jgi:hypothetical protein
VIVARATSLCHPKPRRKVCQWQGQTC